MIRRLAAVLLLAAGPATAQMATVGDIHIEAPMLRDTAPNAPVAGGFVTIVNTGTRDDTLVAASIAADAAGEVQLHSMDITDGVMRMSQVAGGIAVPAGETVTLAPGGLHLMLLRLSAPLMAGDTYPVTLTFAQAGSVTLDFPVLTLGEIRAAEAGHASGATHGTGMDHGAMNPATAPKE